MKRSLIFFAAFLLLLPAGAEKVIARARKAILSTETRKGPIIHKAFYVFKPAKNYRGKKVMSA